jgi:hypothetical protein
MEIHMETISLARKQWAEVSHELESVRIGPTPRGLRGRVQRLLADTPAMREETLSLVLDPSAASTVWWILRRAQRRTAETPDGGKGNAAAPTRKGSFVCLSVDLATGLNIAMHQ